MDELWLCACMCVPDGVGWTATEMLYGKRGMTLTGGFNTAKREALIGSFSLLVCKGYAHSQCSPIPAHSACTVYFLLECCNEVMESFSVFQPLTDNVLEEHALMLQ